MAPLPERTARALTPFQQAVRGGIPANRRSGARLPRKLVGRVWAVLFVACGLLSLAGGLLTGSREASPGLILTSGFALLAGAACVYASSRSWPAWTFYLPVPVALALIALDTMFSSQNPFVLAVFYCVVFAVMGLTLPRGVGLATLPLLAITFITSTYASTADAQATMTSFALVAIACAGVAELLAWLVSRLQPERVGPATADGALDEITANLTSLDPGRLATTAAARLSGLLDVPEVHVFRLNEDDTLTCLAWITTSETGERPRRPAALASWPAAADAARTRRQILVTSRGESAGASASDAAGGTDGGSSLIVPLVARDTLVGFIDISETRAGRGIHEKQMSLAASVCPLIALSILDAGALEAKQAQADKLTFLLESSQAVNGASTIVDALTILAQRSCEILDATECTAYEYRDTSDAIVCRALWQQSPASDEHLHDLLPLDEHPVERTVLASNEPLLETVSDPLLAPMRRWALQQRGAKSRLTIPMRSTDGTVGLLVLWDARRERHLTDDEMALAVGLGQLAGSAVRTNRLLRTLRHLSETDSLTGLANHRKIHELLLREHARAERHGSRFSLVMLDVDGFKAFNDAYGHPVGDIVLKRVAGVLRENTRASDVVGRYGGDEFVLILPETGTEEAAKLVGELRTMLSRSPYVAPSGLRVPIRLSAGIAAYPADGRDVNELVLSADAKLYASKRRGGDTVTTGDDAMLVQDDPSDRLRLLESLVAAIDTKDNYTRHHSDEVTLFSLAIAEMIGLSGESLRVVRTAGLLHDVGRIGIPDHILMKQGELTDEEQTIVRGHAALGETLITGVPDLDDIRAAVISHHEHYDGSGYPDGLCGEAIPLIGRILAVADAYSAMTSERPYRKAMTGEAAITELRAGSGKQYDPAIVEAFVRCLEPLGAEADLPNC